MKIDQNIQKCIGKTTSKTNYLDLENDNEN